MFFPIERLFGARLLRFEQLIEPMWDLLERHLPLVSQPATGNWGPDTPAGGLSLGGRSR